MAPRSRYRTIQRQIGTRTFQGSTGAGIREAQRTSNILTSALNDMSNYFMKKAGTQAEIEGAEFGAKNPITEEQLRDSVGGGKDFNEFLGDKDTIFGRSARKAQLSILQSELELSAKTQMSEEIANATIQNLDPAEVADRLDVITNEFTKLSNDVSPILGQKMFASLNTASAGKYSTYNQKYANARFTEIKAKKLAIVSHNLNAITDEVGSIISSIGEDESLGKKLISYEQAIKNKILQDLSGVGTKEGTFKSNFKTVEDNILLAKNNFIITSAVRSDSELALVKAINSNNYNKINTKVAKVLKTMDADDIEKLKLDLRNEAQKQITDYENETKVKIIENQDTIFEANTKFHDFLSAGNKDEAQKQINIIKKYDRDKAEALQEKLSKGKSTRSESDDNTMIILNRKKDAGTLTYEDLENASALLKNEDIIKLNTAIVDNEDKELSSALVTLSGLLNTEFPGFTAKTMETVIKNDGYSKPRAIYQRIKGKLETLKRNAIRTSSEVDLVSAMEDMVGNVSTEIGDKIKAQNLASAKLQIGRLKKLYAKKYPEINDFTDTDFNKVIQFLDRNVKLKATSQGSGIYKVIEKHLGGS